MAGKMIFYYRAYFHFSIALVFFLFSVLNVNEATNISVSIPSFRFNNDNRSLLRDRKYEYVLSFLMEYNGRFSTDNVGTVRTSHNSETEKEEYTTPAMFVDMCSDYFLSPEVTSDDYISSKDVGNFYEYLCGSLDVDSCKGLEIAFYSLSIYIQLEFVDALCPRDELSDEELSLCIDELSRQSKQGDNDFGLEITKKMKTM